MFTIEEFTHWGIDVRIVHDEDAGNPYDNMDQASRIVGLHELHREGWSEEEYPTTEDRDLPVLLRWLTLFGGEAVALPFVFHDYGSSGLRASLVSPNYGEAAGFVCVSREKMLAEWPDGGTINGEHLSSVQMAERCARDEFGTWAAWLEGDVAGYVVAAGSPDEDSCWGFYGPDAEKFAAEEAREAAESAAFDREKRRLEHRRWLLDPDADPAALTWEEFRAQHSITTGKTDGSVGPVIHSTIEDAVAWIDAQREHDAEGVERGDYYIDAPEREAVAA